MDYTYAEASKVGKQHLDQDTSTDDKAIYRNLDFFQEENEENKGNFELSSFQKEMIFLNQKHM